MASNEQKTAATTAFNGVISRLRAEIAANSGAAEDLYVADAATLNYAAPIVNVLVAVETSYTLSLGTGFQTGNVVNLYCYVAADASLTISSTSDIAVFGGTTESSHSLAGRLSVLIKLRKTASGWELFL